MTKKLDIVCTVGAGILSTIWVGSKYAVISSVGVLCVVAIVAVLVSIGIEPPEGPRWLSRVAGATSIAGIVLALAIDICVSYVKFRDRCRERKSLTANKTKSREQA